MAGRAWNYFTKEIVYNYFTQLHDVSLYVSLFPRLFGLERELISNNIEKTGWGSTVVSLQNRKEEPELYPVVKIYPVIL